MYTLLIITKLQQNAYQHASRSGELRISTVVATFETLRDAEVAENQLADFESYEGGIFIESVRLGVWKEYK